MGKNKLASLVPIVVQIYQFENPQGHKAHEKRVFGKTLLSNSSVNLKILKVTRHMKNEPLV